MLLAVLVSSGWHNKTPQTGDLNNRNLFPHGHRDWESKIKVLADSGSGEIPALLRLVFHRHPHEVFSLCWLRE